MLALKRWAGTPLASAHSMTTMFTAPLRFLKAGTDSVGASVREAEKAALVMFGSAASRVPPRIKIQHEFAPVISESGEDHPATANNFRGKKTVRILERIRASSRAKSSITSPSAAPFPTRGWWPETRMTGILVCGDNHFIVNGPLPDRATALALAHHWSIIRIVAIDATVLAGVGPLSRARSGKTWNGRWSCRAMARSLPPWRSCLKKCQRGGSRSARVETRERQSPDWRLRKPPIGRLAFPGVRRYLIFTYFLKRCGRTSAA